MFLPGETCTAGSCTCVTPGICPLTNGVPNQCGPDTCGIANGCNGPNACPTGEICSSGQCVSNCLACQSWNGTACVSRVPCGSSQCGIDSCGNACGSGCASGFICNNTGPGTCICSPSTPCPTSNGCGSDSCGKNCGANGGGCPTGGKCSDPTLSTPGTCSCTPNPACSATLNCSSDNCGNVCGSCPPPGQPGLTGCSSTTKGTPGSCVCQPKTPCPATWLQYG